MSSAKSVMVEYSDEFHALWMHWDKDADKRDVEQAYREITSYLNTIDSPTYVIVDLRENVYMPLQQTMTGALYGPYSHSKLQAWLVIGTNTLAKVVAATLNAVTKQDKVIWFNNENDLKTYLEAHNPRYTE